ncbi:MAG: hypothetical protein ACP5ER_05320 [Candidatus Bathyarchaeales archaeon]
MEKLSVNENLDVDNVIKRLLSAGAKTPRELREAVIRQTGVSERVYYKHLKKLREKKEVKETLEEISNGQTVRKYELTRETQSLAKYIRPAGPPDFEPTRRLLELAAWIKSEPDGWVESDDVKKAKSFVLHHLVPEIKPPYEDPDSYVFVWPHEDRAGLNFYDYVYSRFFSFKQIYEAVSDEREKEALAGDLFVGAYCSPVIAEYVTAYENMEDQMRSTSLPCEFRVIEGPHSVCVAVLKETGGAIHVVHVESRKGELDKTWVKSLAKWFGAKKYRIMSYDSLKESVKRESLINLREVLGQHKLLIPKRYVKLIEELLDYSYKKPSSGYVLALAIAVNLAFHAG